MFPGEETGLCEVMDVPREGSQGCMEVGTRCCHWREGQRDRGGRGTQCCMWSLKVLQDLGGQPYWVGYKYVAMAERGFSTEEEASAHAQSWLTKFHPSPDHANSISSIPLKK